MELEKLFIESPTFETNRLLLRKFVMSDAEDYFQFASEFRPQCPLTVLCESDIGEACVTFFALAPE